MAELFSAYLQQYTYTGLIAVLIGTGIGLPFPESIVLILGGFLVYSGRTELASTVSACYIGVLAGDMISYQMGRKWGEKIINGTTRKGVLTAEKWGKVKKHFSRHENKTIFLSRFIPGIRVAAHIMAGVLKVKAVKFFFLNSVAALINVPILVYVGYIFGNKIEKTLRYSRGLSLLLATLIIAGAGVGALYFLIRYKRAQQDL